MDYREFKKRLLDLCIDYENKNKCTITRIVFDADISIISDRKLRIVIE